MLLGAWCLVPGAAASAVQGAECWVWNIEVGIGVGWAPKAPRAGSVEPVGLGLALGSHSSDRFLWAAGRQ